MMKDPDPDPYIINRSGSGRLKNISVRFRFRNTVFKLDHYASKITEFVPEPPINTQVENISTNFREKIQNGPKKILGGGGVDRVKLIRIENLISKISWQTPLTVSGVFVY
jgi:hypothetical protein